jgi:hypothetical protein
MQYSVSSNHIASNAISSTKLQGKYHANGKVALRVVTEKYCTRFVCNFHEAKR